MLLLNERSEVPPRYAIRLDDLRAWHAIVATCAACGKRTQLTARSCPWRWCRSWAAGMSVAGRAALVHAAAAGSMRVRSSRIGAMVSRVM